MNADRLKQLRAKSKIDYYSVTIVRVCPKLLTQFQSFSKTKQQIRQDLTKIASKFAYFIYKKFVASTVSNRFD